MAEPEGVECCKEKIQKPRGGLYIKKGIPISADRVKPAKLQEVSLKSGVDFVYDGDKNTFTSERYVVIPKK